MNAAQTDVSPVTFYTTRFGDVETDTSKIITFPEGLLGFGAFKRYHIIQDPDQEPFLWLQSVDEPDLAFVIVDPFLFFPGYEIEVKPHELNTIQVNDVSKATVLTIVTIPKDPNNISANLRGPLVFNMDMRLGKQLVLIDDRYDTRHFLLKDIPDYLAAAPMATVKINSANTRNP